MTLIIGSHYHENLERIKHLIKQVQFGAYQETTEILTVPGKGRCYYNHCPDKTKKSETILVAIHEQGQKIERTAFHTPCLDALINDKNIQSLN